MPKNLKSIARTALLIFVGLVLGVNVYLWNARSLTGNRMPMPFGIGAAVVLSGSMEPELSVNDLVLIREESSYEVGDIIVYQSGGSLVIHRIEAMDDDTVTARGDANNASDAPVPLSAVKGRLAFAVPGVGAVTRVLKTWPGVLALVGGALFLLERSRRKEKEADAEALDALKAQIRALKQELETEGETQHESQT